MAISDTITSMYENVGNVYDVLELAGAGLTNVDKNILNLKQSWEERLLYFLANGTDVVWNNWLPKVTGTGETITLNNTIEAKMDIVYKGNTSQYSTTGKNLFDISTITSITNGAISDEIITTNETSNSTYTVFPFFSNISLPANTYYLSMDIRIKSGTGTLNKINDAANDWGAVSKPPLSTTFQRYVSSHTYTSGTTLDHILIQFISSTNAVYEIKNIMISTSSDTTYEEYTGNQPSPSPDYPQDIQVVSGDNTIKVEGKNLFNAQIQAGTYNQATYTVASDGLITQSASDDSGWGASNRMFTLEAGTYTISIIGKDNSSRLQVRNITDNSDVIQTQNNSETFTLTSKKKVALKTWGGSHYPLSYYIQIEKGNQVTSYQAYQTPQTYPINLGDIELCKIGDYQDKIAKSSGKNLFDKDSVVGGFVNADGSVGGDTNAYRTSDFIPIQPNMAYYKTSTESPRTKYYDGNKQPLNTTTYQDISIGGNAGTFTTPNNAYYLRFSYPVASVDVNSIMINEGTTALPYEPYGKVWYLNKQIGKVVLDGSETGWNEYIQNGVINCFNNSLITFTNQNGFSNYFTLSTDTSYSNTKPRLILFNTLRGLGIYASINIFATLAQFKTWLSTHNTTVYYVLATPTNEEITDSTLISQLEAIKKSYNTQTNISQENNDLPFELDVVALGKLS